MKTFYRAFVLDCRKNVQRRRKRHGRFLKEYNRKRTSFYCCIQQTKQVASWKFHVRLKLSFFRSFAFFLSPLKKRKQLHVRSFVRPTRAFERDALGPSACFYMRTQRRNALSAWRVMNDPRLTFIQWTIIIREIVWRGATKSASKMQTLLLLHLWGEREKQFTTTVLISQRFDLFFASSRFSKRVKPLNRPQDGSFTKLL